MECRWLVCLLLIGCVAGYDVDFLDGVSTAVEVKGTTSCSCGWTRRGRIVGGKETKKNEYPLVVSIEYKPMKMHMCGGSILTPWHVLTAAHCTRPVTVNDLAINFGIHDLESSQSKPRIEVASIINHEQYMPRAIKNDIALLVTATEIKFNQNVGPACLPSSKLSLQGELIKAIGWGSTTEGGSSSNSLQKVNLRVIDFNDCLSRWQASKYKKRPTEGKNVCTFTEKKDTCKGDSGGPLIWLNPSNSRYSVVALVSYGGECGGNLPAVNTDVTAFLPWINSKINETKPGVAACSAS